MKAFRIVIAILLFVIPIGARTLWFYQGVYQRSAPVITPDYSSLTVPQPLLSTPISDKSISYPMAPIVLFDVNHIDLYLFSEIKPLTDALSTLGASVRITDDNILLSEQLKQANAYVVIAPVVPFNPLEVTAIQDFVHRGGRLLVISDPTRNTLSTSSTLPTFVQPVDIANFILEPFGITFNNDYVYNLVENEANFRNIILKDFGKHSISEGLTEIVLYGAHSIKTAQTPVFTADPDTLSSLTDKGGNVVLAATGADGNVLAIGDFSFMTAPFIEVADNQILVKNISRFLLSGTRTHDLTDYPYLFSHPATFLVKDSSTSDRETVNMMGTLQKGLALLNISFSIANKPQEGKDLIVTSTFKKADEIKEYTKSFNLSFSTEPLPTAEPEGAAVQLSELAKPTPTPIGTETLFPFPVIEPTPSTRLVVNLPGFGKVSTVGTGVILYLPSPERNTLILFAENSQALLEFAGIISSGSLSGCMIQQDIALCPLTPADSGSSGTNRFP